MVVRLDRIINKFHSNRGFRYKLNDEGSDTDENNIFDRTDHDAIHIDVRIWAILKSFHSILNTNSLIYNELISYDSDD